MADNHSYNGGTLRWIIYHWVRGVGKANLCTGIIGILGICLCLVAELGTFQAAAWIVINLLGAGLFIWSVGVLVYNLTHEDPEILYENPNYSVGVSRRGLTRLDLLSEEGAVIRSWDLFDKISLVIGKDIGENSVDIDLKDSVYASMIDVEHAVLNYANGEWYIEDLGSSNGISVIKAGTKKEYKLSQTQHCKLSLDDVICIGMAQLRIY